MTAKMTRKIQEVISKTPVCTYPLNATAYQAKVLEGIDLIVKVHVNVFDAGFMNRDICRVIAQTEDDKLIIKRLEDGHEGVVDKNKVSYPEWGTFPF